MKRPELWAFLSHECADIGDPQVKSRDMTGVVECVKGFSINSASPLPEPILWRRKEIRNSLTLQKDTGVKWAFIL